MKFKSQLLNPDRMALEFASQLALELRVPLTSIHGYTQILSSGVGGELTNEQKKFLILEVHFGLHSHLHNHLTLNL